jgi:hypothetical protein
MWTVEDIDAFGVPFSMKLTQEDLRSIPHAAMDRL